MATSQLSLFALADSAAVPEGTGILRKPRRTAAAEALRLPAHELDAVAQQWEEDAHAARTKKAYRADLAAFQAWCAVHGEGALPASTETLRRYLMSLALRGLRPSTIRRARKSIGLAHAHAALPRPDRDGRVRSLEYSIGRKLGAREEGAQPLLLEQLQQLVRVLGDSPRDDRDRAVLLVGFAGAFRAGELCGLAIPDIRFDAHGLHITLQRSKEDQLGEGREVLIRPSDSAPERCAVAALKQWMGRVGRPAGPLFRHVRGAVIEHRRLHERTISRIVEQTAKRAGVVGDFSAHSLRAGYATSAKEAGVAELDIQAHGRWAHRVSLARYIDTRRTPTGRDTAAGLL